MRAARSIHGFYKRWISPILGPRCRFHPTCSTYLLEAIETHGIVKGLALGAWRVCRCNPWCAGGDDPVPAKRTREFPQN